MFLLQPALFEEVPKKLKKESLNLYFTRVVPPEVTSERYVLNNPLIHQTPPPTPPRTTTTLLTSLLGKIAEGEALYYLGTPQS